MSSISINNKIKLFTKEVKENYKKKEGKDLEPTYDNMTTLGKTILTRIPELVENRKQDYKTFNYVAWKWYESILKRFDNEHHFWIDSWSDNYQVVVVKMLWLGKEYQIAYGVEDSPFKSAKRSDGTKYKTDVRVDNLGEKLVNEGMRAYAKLASRITGLFIHLWLEGDNN